MANTFSPDEFNKLGGITKILSSGSEALSSGLQGMQTGQKSAQSVTGLTPSNSGQVLRELPPLVGFTAGEAFGGPVGAGIGGAIGETISQGVEVLSGKRENIDIGQIATTGALGWLVPKGLEVGGKALKYAGKVLEPLTNIAKSGFRGVKNALPGISEDSSLTISKFPKEVEALASQKKLNIIPVVETLQEAKNIIKKKAGQEFDSALKNFYQSGEKFNYNKQELLNSTKQILADNRIVQKPNGILNFDKSYSGNDTANNILEDIILDIKNTRIITIDDLRALKSRSYDRFSKIPMSADGKVPQAKVIATKVLSKLDDFVPESLKPANKDYSERMQLISWLDDIVPVVKDIRGQVSPSAVSKSKQLMKEEIRSIYGDKFDSLYKETGINLDDGLDILNAAIEINPNLIKQDIGGVISIIQKAANPVIGTAKIEAAKLRQSPAGQGVSSMVQSTIPMVKKLAPKVLKGATFETSKQGIQK